MRWFCRSEAAMQINREADRVEQQASALSDDVSRQIDDKSARIRHLDEVIRRRAAIRWPTNEPAPDPHGGADRPDGGHAQGGAA
jgi:hypothetical protein